MEAFGWVFKILAVIALGYLFWTLGAPSRERKRLSMETAKQADMDRKVAERRRIHKELNERMAKVLSDAGLPQQVQVNMVDPATLKNKEAKP